MGLVLSHEANLCANTIKKPGEHIAGLSSLELAPKEWLVDDIKTSFITGVVKDPVQLQTGKTFLEIQFTPQSYDYDEKPKTAKGLEFFETKISGIVNDISPSLLSALETYRYHEFICIATDRQRRKRIVGEKENGLVLRFSSKNNNTPGGSNSIAVELSLEAEKSAPFYLYNTGTASGSTSFILMEDGYSLLLENGTGKLLKE